MSRADATAVVEVFREAGLDLVRELDPYQRHDLEEKIATVISGTEEERTGEIDEACAKARCESLEAAQTGLKKRLETWAKATFGDAFTRLAHAEMTAAIEKAIEEEMP